MMPRGEEGRILGEQEEVIISSMSVGTLGVTDRGTGVKYICRFPISFDPLFLFSLGAGFGRDIAGVGIGLNIEVVYWTCGGELDSFLQGKGGAGEELVIVAVVSGGRYRSNTKGTTVSGVEELAFKACTKWGIRLAVVAV